MSSAIACEIRALFARHRAAKYDAGLLAIIERAFLGPGSTGGNLDSIDGYLVAMRTVLERVERTARTGDADATWAMVAAMERAQPCLR